MLMKIYIVLIVIVLCGNSCNQNYNTKQPKKTHEFVVDTAIEPKPTIIAQDTIKEEVDYYSDNVFEYEGFIDDKYEIKIHLFQSFGSKDEIYVSGYYWYTSSLSRFSVSGEIKNNQLKLIRYDDIKIGEIKEEFNINLDDWSSEIRGTWQKKGKEEKKVTLTYKPYYSSESNNFFYEVYALLDQRTNSLINLKQFKSIEFKDDQFRTKEVPSACYFNGHRFVLEGYTEGSFSNKDERVETILITKDSDDLPGAVEGLSFVEFHLFDESIENDLEEMNHSYYWSLISYFSDAGELIESQKISGTFEGEFNYILTESKLILYLGDKIETHYFE